MSALRLCSDVEERSKAIASTIGALSDEQAYDLLHDWSFWARPNQLLPPGDWTYWLILAGRGWGKTRVGAETVRIWARDNRYVNLIGATADDARAIMIEGESGLLNICPKGERPEYKRHERRLVWPSGCVSEVFTADEPERLRGKQHMKAWADEMAAWRYPEAWDQLKFGLRLGDRPQVVITTTPRPKDMVRQIIADRATYLTRGSTAENRANLAAQFFSEITRKYEGTRLGRQELDAELLDDTPGALWQRSKIDEMRIPISDAPVMQRIVVAIDPAVSTHERSNETGIIAAGLGQDGRGYILADASGVMTPDEWAREALALFRRYSADAIVVEKNQGGNLVAHTIQGHAPNAPIREVVASRGKITRAEPVSALYEQGRVSHVGAFPILEDQMCQFTSDFDRSAQGFSPDRVDAAVWALTELMPVMIQTQRRGVRVTRYAQGGAYNGW